MFLAVSLPEGVATRPLFPDHWLKVLIHILACVVPRMYYFRWPLYIDFFAVVINTFTICSLWAIQCIHLSTFSKKDIKSAVLKFRLGRGKVVLIGTCMSISSVTGWCWLWEKYGRILLEVVKLQPVSPNKTKHKSGLYSLLQAADLNALLYIKHKVKVYILHPAHNSLSICLIFKDRLGCYNFPRL